MDRDPEEPHGRVGAASCIASKTVEEVEEVTVRRLAVGECRKRVDLPLLARVKLLLVVVNVADNLCNAVEVGKTPVDGETNRGAALAADEVIEERQDDGVRLLAVSPKEEDRMDVGGPAR